MIAITDNETAAQAKYAIELALLSGTDWQMLANDEFVTELRPEQNEFSVAWSKLIFAWWNDEQSQSWRVTHYEITTAEITLRATRGLAKETAVIVLRDVQRWRARQQTLNLPADERRRLYGSVLAQAITSHYNGAVVQRLNTSGHRQRSLPVQYARLVIELRGETVLAIGANTSEPQTNIDATLTAGLIWLAGFNEKRAGRQRARRLWVCVPCGRSQTTLERLTLIDARHIHARVECLEVDEEQTAISAVRAMTQAELFSEQPRELQWPDRQPANTDWHERILSLAPDLIEARYIAAQDAESFSLHGLEFARIIHCHTRPRAQFGLAAALQTDPVSEARPLPKMKPLTEASMNELAALVGDIVAHRCAQTSDRHHPFYQLRTEAWLESLLRRNITVLDASLDPRFVYSQVPAWRGTERSVIDLLTVNHAGRLVVIEIKAAEDMNLPLQGLDYWLRVAQACARGEFALRGLFPGIRLSDESPLLYLVAPRLRFHRTFRTVARCLATVVEAYQIGINSNWRAGVRVHTKERVNGEE